jgi:hypothetical protein
MSVLKPYETWKPVVSLTQMNLKKNYAVTDFGRMISYTDNIEEGKEVGKSIINGYPVLSLKPFHGKKNLTLLVHKVVAEYFLEPPTPEQIFIIHKDQNKKNNRPGNLKWVTKEEWWAHWKTSDAVIESLQKLHAPKQQGHKLSSTEVMRIKKMLADPNRKTRIKNIAKQFGISEMQLYRIKSGENWSHIKIN